ncbi:cnl2/NKP2 family protein [Hirsutella rhossiliensis]|uniref:Cnl2/NKP2 family protein n=1 Tax=Hirsutella rhossiliensis TaxID=111463 RepID=A0A9P8MUS9_9HYPO|nr:cnl2/NKP2 family protein [Hirsutella rhossiliensis]KAH0960824.1 cnl2/NKP2 family protein [Hirsutella rhossiliensis]
MAPTESDILTHYLVQPAPLTAITTFEQFQALFPRQLRTAGGDASTSHQQQQQQQPLRSLFRDLQAQRNARVVDAVAENVAAEARRGAAMRREVLRQRRRDDDDADGDADGEVDMERALFGDASGARGARHTVRSVVPELDGAAEALEAEIRQLRDEEAALMASVKQTIGGLSDLRYGKLANGKLRGEVLDGLDSLQQTCHDKS